MQYYPETYTKYRVDITNVLTSRNFDHYLIQLPDSDKNALRDTEKHIHERYPHNILKVVFEKK